MNRFLYDIFLALYSLIAEGISPFNPKAKKWVEGRKHVWDELEKLPVGKKRIWFHCASLGEYEQALPLIERMGANGELGIIVTFFSPSGYEVVKKKSPNALVFYLPHDSKANAKIFLDKIQPMLAVFVRYDLWYHYLKELRERNIQTVLISAVFRKEDVFFQWYGKLFREMLSCFTHIFVQDEDSKTILSKRGFQNVTKAGDTRIDRVVAIRERAKQFPIVEQFKGKKKVLIIGSLESGDLKAVIPLINDSSFKEHFKFIIAPHDVSKERVRNLSQMIKGKAALYSETDSQSVLQSDVLIIDGIGMLSSLYRYADIAYIGGGFGEGLHNVLEPAAWGIPVLFGPEHQKFLEAVELVKIKGAFVVKDENELKEKVLRLLSDETSFKKASESASRFIDERKGGTEIIFSQLHS